MCYVGKISPVIMGIKAIYGNTSKLLFVVINFGDSLKIKNPHTHRNQKQGPNFITAQN